jgi:hypothetical protein
MFDPKKVGKQSIQKQRERQLRDFALSLVPVHLTEGLLIDVKEVVCGDPSCAPIDTVITFVWSGSSLGKGMFAIPLPMEEIQPQDMEEMFPDEECLTKWKSGKKARWPPAPKLGPLRFSVGDRVECRIGPHPVKGWAPGRVVRLYYKETNWPPSMFAPYQIALHDGRLIYAPQDTDQVIRLRPPLEPNAPPSPDLSAYYDYDGQEPNDEEDDDDDMKYEVEGDDLPELEDDGAVNGFPPK